MTERDSTGNDGGRATLSSLFTWRSAIADSGLPPTTRLVAFTLALHMSERGDSCYPSVATVAAESGLSKNAVRKHVRLLQERGWMRVDVGGGRRSSCYTATVPTPTPDGGHPPTTLTPAPHDVVGTPPPGGAEVFIESDIEDDMEVHIQQRPRRTVARKVVTDREWAMAEYVIATWNIATEQRLTVEAWHGKIVMRVREHPELSMADHAHIIGGTLGGPRWWSGPPTPSIVYGNAAQFERAMTAVRNPQPSGGQAAYDVALAALEEGTR